MRSFSGKQSDSRQPDSPALGLPGESLGAMNGRDSVLRLQNSVGNQATQGLLRETRTGERTGPGGERDEENEGGTPTEESSRDVTSDHRSEEELEGRLRELDREIYQNERELEALSEKCERLEVAEYVLDSMALESGLLGRLVNTLVAAALVQEDDGAAASVLEDPDRLQRVAADYIRSLVDWYAVSPLLPEEAVDDLASALEEQYQSYLDEFREKSSGERLLSVYERLTEISFLVQIFSKHVRVAVAIISRGTKAVSKAAWIAKEVLETRLDGLRREREVVAASLPRDSGFGGFGGGEFGGGGGGAGW